MYKHLSVCLLCISILLCISCKSQETMSTQSDIDTEINKIIDRAIMAEGGWDNWQNLVSISYKKRSILYLKDGSKESDMTQFHEYQFGEQMSGNIFWKDNDGSHSIVYQDGLAYEYLNGQKLEDSKESATKAFHSATYVLLMPFKLKDPNVALSYLGTETLADGKIADVIKAVYNPDQHATHSTDDTWNYYFDQSSGEYLAAMVYHAPTYAYIENTKRDRSLPIAMPIYRESYRSDAERNKEFLRGEFFYSDYDIKVKGL